MRNDRDKAIELRMKGKSYNEISRSLKVPKSTLSGWLSSLRWSENIKQVLRNQAQKRSTIRIIALNKVRGEHLRKVYREARSEALQDFNDLKYHPMFLAALMIYWGEGDRVTKDKVRVSNADPKMIKLFMLFLRDICQIPVEKIRLNLFIYSDLDDMECRRFWSERIGLGQSAFTKSILLPSRHKTKRVRYGMCNITVSSSYLKAKVMEWLRFYSNELVERSYYNAELV